MFSWDRFTAAEHVNVFVRPQCWLNNVELSLRTLALKFALFICIPYVVSRKWQSLWDWCSAVHPNGSQHSSLFWNTVCSMSRVGSKVPPCNSRLFTVCLIWQASAGEQPWEIACAKEQSNSATAGAENVLVVSEPLCLSHDFIEELKSICQVHFSLPTDQSHA